MISAEQLKEIKARCEAATLGPWMCIDDGFYGAIESESAFIFGGEPSEGRIDATDPNAIFTAHARTDVPRLLDSLDAEEAENARLRELVGALKDLSQCETNYRLTGEEIRDWEKLEGKAPEGLKDALTKFLSERCDLINRVAELEADAPQPQGGAQ